MSEWAAKRFWSQATTARQDAGFAVYLDGRPVRTPAKNQLILPTQKMAQAIAQEWDAQVDKIDPLSMPVTRSANAALDKVAVQKDEVADLITDYGDSDLICYRAQVPDALIKRQAAVWDPLIDWARSDLDAPLSVHPGVMHVPQSPQTLDKLKTQVAQLDPFQLTGFHDLVALSGSLIIGFAVTRNFAPAEQLWQQSRIDELWQQEQWGEDEEANLQAERKQAAFLHADRFYRLSA